MTEVVLALMFFAILTLTGFVAYRAGSVNSYGTGFTDGYADGCKHGEFMAVLRQVSR